MTRTYEEMYKEMIETVDNAVSMMISKGLAESGISGIDEEGAEYLTMALAAYNMLKKLTMEQSTKMDEMAEQIEALTKVAKKMDKLIDDVEDIKKIVSTESAGEILR